MKLQIALPKFLPGLFLMFLGDLTCIPLHGQAIITLVVPPGARQLALGEAGTALIDKSHSYFYNPALPGLSYPDAKREISVSSLRYI